MILRNLSRANPVVSHGKGIYLFDQSGKKYLDASGGAMVVSVGHGNQEVADRVAKQLKQVAYVNGTHFTSQPTEELATSLAAYGKPIGLDRCCFLNSGSEAVEAAVKFARQLWVERGRLQKSKFISRTPSYHGNTLFALALSGRPQYKKPYAPLLPEVLSVVAPYEYRSAVDNYVEDGGKYYADLIEKAILEAGPETVAALIVEPIIGSSAGASCPPPDYFSRVQEICHKYEVLIIADEIMTGTGRTGSFFACEHYGLKPDILLLGKGINGGYVPLSVLMTRDEYIREMKAGSGGFSHAQTFLHSPCMTVAGVAILDQIEKYGLIANARGQGEFLLRRLHEELSEHSYVGHIGGKGLLCGVEFVQDKKTKKPFARSEKFVEKFLAHSFSKGLILWSNTGQADNINGDLVMLAPPLNVTTSEVEEIVTLFADCVRSFELK